MKLLRKRYICVVAVFLLLGFTLSCTMGNYLRTERDGEVDITGEVTLLLHGAGYLERMVIFDPEGDDYTFEITGPAERYIVEQGVSARKAREIGAQFVTTRKVTRKILSNDGKVIGYEMRPLYHAFRYGSSDVLDVSYKQSDNKVLVTIGLKDSVRKLFHNDLFGGE